jgi:Protein of unknown function (DUF3352)
MPRLRLRRKRLDKAPKKPKGKKSKKEKKAAKAAAKAAAAAEPASREKPAKTKGKKGKKRELRTRTGLASRLPRPRIPRPRIPRPKLKRPSRPGFIPRDLWFRLSTRFKALGYGAREQAWKLSRRVERRVEVPLVGFWRRRSQRTRIGVLSAAGVLLLLAVVRFISVPGVPCEISAAKDCPPGDAAVAMAPANSLLYAHITLDDAAAQYADAGDVFDHFQRFGELGQAAIDTLHTPSGTQVTFKQVREWAGDDAAIAMVPAKGGIRSTAVMISVDDQKAADAFVATLAPAKGGQPSTVDGVKLTTYPGGFATANDNGFVLLGGSTAVTSAIATGAGKQQALGAEPTAGPTRADLPDNRFADIYVSAQGVQTIFAPSTSAGATQLDTFVDYASTKGFAAAAVARDDGIELDLVSALDPAKEKQSPSAFTALPKFHPDLTHEVGARALGYIGIGDAGEALTRLLTRATSAQPGIAQSFASFSRRLKKEAKVNPSKDLFPALGGQAALVAEPTDGIPFASLIVDGVDEKKAKDALARLQAPLARSLSPPGGQALPGFTTTSIDGTEASELQVSPTLNLTYAVFDGKLVISTQPGGIEQVKSGGGATLTTAPAFRSATEPLPDELSALVFFNLDELLDLAEALGRVEDPLYTSFRDDIRKLHAIAVGVNAGGNELHSRLFVTID